jgi:hypothetical protein
VNVAVPTPFTALLASIATDFVSLDCLLREAFRCSTELDKTCPCRYGCPLRNLVVLSPGDQVNGGLAQVDADGSNVHAMIFLGCCRATMLLGADHLIIRLLDSHRTHEVSAVTGNWRTLQAKLISMSFVNGDDPH